MSGRERLSTIRNYIASNEVELAIYELFDLSEGTKYQDDIIAAASHYSLLKENEVRGISFPEEFTKLVYRLLSISNELQSFFQSNLDYSQKKTSNLLDSLRRNYGNEDIFNHIIFDTCFDNLEKLMHKYDSHPLGNYFEEKVSDDYGTALSRLRKLNSIEFTANLMNLSTKEVEQYFTSSSENITEELNIEGLYNCRWNTISRQRFTFGSKKYLLSDWHKGKAKISKNKNKFKVICYDETNEYVIFGVQQKNKLIGRYMACRNQDDNSPFFGIIRSDSEINGHWALGNWQFFK